MRGAQHGSGAATGTRHKPGRRLGPKRRSNRWRNGRTGPEERRKVALRPSWRLEYTGMTDFVIVAAAAALLASPTVADTPLEAVVPQNSPTVGFVLYRDVGSCEAAVAGLKARPGQRLVCLPVERSDGEMASAY